MDQRIFEEARTRGTAFPIEPISYALEDLPRVTGFSRTRIFNAVRAGELMARKDGRQTVVEAEEVRRWIKSRPTKGRRPSEAA